LRPTVRSRRGEPDVAEGAEAGEASSEAARVGDSDFSSGSLRLAGGGTWRAVDTTGNRCGLVAGWSGNVPGSALTLPDTGAGRLGKPSPAFCAWTAAAPRNKPTASALVFIA
jgi:hypothetical protein